MNAKPTQAPAIDPAVINRLNPLIEESQEDTILGVSEVLAFLSVAMEHAENASDHIPVDGGCMGLSRILDTCRSALNFHLRDVGGAV
jgi:hypothetical protein